MTLILKIAILLNIFYVSFLQYVTSCSSNENTPLSPKPPTNSFCYSLLPKTLVHITNYLDPGTNLTVDCNGQGKDVGTQVINYGLYYEFRFIPNFWSTTRYFCNFTWSGGSQGCYIYKYHRDLHRCCDTCMWNVDHEGAHGINKFTGKPDVIICQWKMFK